MDSSLLKNKLILILFLGLLVGCQKADLSHGLSEIEADEIMNLLHQNGIEAEKKKEITGQEVFWIVRVAGSREAQARQILIANNVPRRREMGLSEVYKEKGLIPTPDEQKARFLLSLKGEIINSLEKIPGVVDADVVLNVPDENEFADLREHQSRPTASVVVRARSTEDSLQVTEGKVQRFVANAVPDLNPNDVAVIITTARGTGVSSGSLFPPVGPTRSSTPTASSVKEVEPWVRIGGIRLQPSSVRRFKVFFISLLSLLVIVSAALLVVIVRLNRIRVRLQSGPPVEALPLAGGQEPPLLGGGGIGSEGTFEIGAEKARKG